jgi:glycosyltransferase involved in cell wall biosynthesis
MTLAVLIPVLDDAASLRRTLDGLSGVAQSIGGVTAYVIDDGSTSPVTPSDFPPTTPFFRMVLARHAVNLGQGAALETARQLALRDAQVTCFVTMDADGQHRSEDAVAVARAIEAGADVAFGNRFLGGSRVPVVRSIVLRAARLFERALTGLRLTDAHNGLRAFSRRAIEQVPIRQNRMAHATEIKQRVARAGALVIVEVPVVVRYTEASLARGQRSLGAVVILRDLAQRYLFGEAE